MNVYSMPFPGAHLYFVIGRMYHNDRAFLSDPLPHDLAVHAMGIVQAWACFDVVSLVPAFPTHV